MTSAAMGYLGKKALQKYRSDRPNSDNPYEEIVAIKENGRIKHKKQKRAILLHEKLSDNDKEQFEWVCRKAYKWDQQFRCCCFGVRFGWSAILGLIPVIGDALEVLLSLILVWKASKIDGGLPRTTKLRMYFNIALDFAIGFIPFLGDLFDIGYRANTRNAWILNNHFVEKLAKIPEKGGNSANGSNDRDLERGLEQGVELMQTAQGVPSAPTAVPPARTPAPKAAIPPGRNLTGRVRDPRDRK